MRLDMFFILAFWASLSTSMNAAAKPYIPSYVGATTLSQVAYLRVPSYSWSGAYFGGYFGPNFIYSSAKTEEALGNFLGNASGASMGIYTGFNMEIMDRLIVGAETEYGYNKDLSSTGTSLGHGWAGATRTRIGYSFDKVLPYLAVGVVYANSMNREMNFAVGDSVSGWTMGGGFDYAISEGVILRLDYQYHDYGYNPSTARSSVLVKTDSNNFHIGIAYKF